MNKEEFQYYEQNCKSLSTLTFIGIKNKIIEYVQDAQTTSAGKIIFADWLFSKISYIWKAPDIIRKDLFTHITSAIQRCENVLIKMKYLNWKDLDFSQKIMYYFYLNRFREDLFIEQMLNDSWLLKWSQSLLEPKELLQHFLKWIGTAHTFEQKSNLLDVLLRYFPSDKNVKKVYAELMKGDDLYTNQENAHDEDISISIKKVIGELHEWNKKNMVYRADNPGKLTRSSWTQVMVSDNCASNEDHSILSGIMKRLAIDKTTFKVRDADGVYFQINAMEVLFLIVNFILSSESKKEMFKSLIGEMKEALELCITGYIQRFVNSIQGYSDKFQTSIPFRKQLHAKVNYDLSKAFLKLPEQSNVVLGITEVKYREEYYNFIKNTVNFHELSEQYGTQDVSVNLPGVLSLITGEDVWKIDDGTLTFAV